VGQRVPVGPWKVAFWRGVVAGQPSKGFIPPILPPLPTQPASQSAPGWKRV
jgi:hypothetical protein